MGYKLAGYRVLGGVEIDPKMMAMYRKNHRPDLSYLMGVQKFKTLNDAEIDPRLFSLDLLDGSPPCSSFSTSGARERKWGTKTKFREGQAEQVLDDLFFDFIDVAKRLRPKVVIAENVKGLVIGKARGYVKQIFAAFDAAGYNVQLFLLNAANMGVPQLRERTFFVARRKDLALPPIVLDFKEKPIAAREALHGAKTNGRPLTPATAAMWAKIGVGANLGEVHPNGSRFSAKKIDPSRVSFTVTASSGHELMHWSDPRQLSEDEIRRLQTFPVDYDYSGNGAHYVCGMSVPPFMMRRVAAEVRRQWLEV